MMRQPDLGLDELQLWLQHLQLLLQDVVLRLPLLHHSFGRRRWRLAEQEVLRREAGR